MKAIVITEPGGPEVLKLQERALPVLGLNEVLIEVKAAGINRPDIFQRKGNYPAPADAVADIPGLEVAGIIREIGSEVTQWKLGDEVMALVSGGGYAEYVNAAAALCLPKPTTLSFAQAASLPETLFTVWHNVFQRGQLKAGENFLVHGGAGGIGITAIQLGKLFGAKVYTTVGSAAKGAKLLELGATAFVNYKAEDFEEALKPIGMDVVLDAIGGDYFEKNLQILNPEGRLVYINAVAGAKVGLNLMKLMQKRIQITGSTLRARDLTFKAALTASIFQEVWPLLANASFIPQVSKTFPLHEAAAAHQQMEEPDHFGKIILITGS